jgi:tRNA dimethylallyltransferase
MSTSKKSTSDNKPIPLLVIVGPTASGKSDLAVKLARRIRGRDGISSGGEIISADSRQVYKGLDIGTGKITTREQHGVPHHLLDVADPRVPPNSTRHFTVEKWRQLAKQAITDIHARGRLPIVCGGTGFYISALVDDVIFPDVPPNKRLRERLAKKSATELFGQLKKLDPRRAREMRGTANTGTNSTANGDWQNPRRLIRAIEIATALGKVPPMSMTLAQSNIKLKKYNPIFIGISLPPEELKKRIEKRLKSRFRSGMIAEVKKLHAPPPRGNRLSYKRMEELGLEYRYISRYLQSQQTAQDKKELIEKLKTEIWRYAKRQMTWWKRDKRIHWLTLEKARSPKLLSVVQRFSRLE